MRPLLDGVRRCPGPANADIQRRHLHFRCQRPHGSQAVAHHRGRPEIRIRRQRRRRLRDKRASARWSAAEYSAEGFLSDWRHRRPVHFQEYLLPRARAYHHGRRVLEGEYFDDRGPALRPNRSEAGRRFHPLLLRHQPRRVLGLAALQLARHDIRLGRGFRCRRHRHALRLHRLRPRQIVARRQRRAAQPRSAQTTGAWSDQR